MVIFNHTFFNIKKDTPIEYLSLISKFKVSILLTTSCGDLTIHFT